jgi:predicted SprT family Zn-dependent metalloprotease
MPWRCPACHTQIRHNEREERPRPRTVYRCHICRIELVLDPTTEKLTLSRPPDGLDEDRK